MASKKFNKSIDSRKRANLSFSLASPSLCTPNLGLTNASKSLRISDSFFNTTLTTPTPTTPKEQSVVFDDNADDEYRVNKSEVQLPYIISEVLSTAAASDLQGVRFYPSGFACLITLKKALIWRYNSKSSSHHVYQLWLPTSDLLYSVNLFAVFCPSGSGSSAAGTSDIMSAITCSPDGIISYWPNIAHSTNMMQKNITDINGQEVQSITDIMPFGFLLATTTATFKLLKPSLSSGEGGITVRNVNLSGEHMLSLGRISSFLWGSSTAGSSSTGVGSNGERCQHVHVSGISAVAADVFILTANNLTKIRFTGNSQQVIYTANVSALFKDSVTESVWQQDTGSDTTQCWPLHMQSSSKGLVIMCAIYNDQQHPNVCFVFGVIPHTADQAPEQFLYLTLVKYNTPYNNVSLDIPSSGSSSDMILSHQFVIPDMSSEVAYIYSTYKPHIICLSVLSSDVDPYVIRRVNDSLLGVGTCNRQLVAFFLSEGVVSISNVPTILARSMYISPTADLTVFNNQQEILRQMCDSDDYLERLRAAFFLFSTHNLTESSDAVSSLISDMSDAGKRDVRGDKWWVHREMSDLVLQLSASLIDAAPASDPRWPEHQRHNMLGHGASLILTQQLKDKQKVHNLFITFVMQLPLYKEIVTSSPGNDGSSSDDDLEHHRQYTSTLMSMCEHGEKLVAALELNTLHANGSSIIDSAISYLVRERREMSSELWQAESLTINDIFYKQVSEVDDIIEGVIHHEEECIATIYNAKHIIQLITDVNHIILCIMTATSAARAHIIEKYMVKWPHMTSAAGSGHHTDWAVGVREHLVKQHDITVSVGIEDATSDNQCRGVLFTHLLQLSDIILDAYSSNSTSMSQDDKIKYDATRNHLLKPFVTHQQYDRGTMLAEKYLDFDTLLQICDRQGRMDKILSYADAYQEHGFSEFIFHWYYSGGAAQRAKLLDEPFISRPDLCQYYSDTPDLAWCHSVVCQDRCDEAAQRLRDLAVEEEYSVEQKRLMLNMSKLMFVAAAGSGSGSAGTTGAAGLSGQREEFEQAIASCDADIQLIQYQKMLPEGVKDTLRMEGQPSDDMRVLSVTDIIQRYISHSRESGSVEHLSTALQLLKYLDKQSQERAELKQVIWEQIVASDNWSRDYNEQSSDEELRHSAVYTCLDLLQTHLITQGNQRPDGSGDLSQYMPANVEQLISSALPLPPPAADHSQPAATTAAAVYCLKKTLELCNQELLLLHEAGNTSGTSSGPPAPPTRPLSVS